MKFLILGDTHTYWERIVPELEEAYKSEKFDAIIQVGDLAFLPKMWNKKLDEINKLIIDWVNEKEIKFYWIDGNHEDHSILQHVDDFNSSIHNIYGKNFFYMPRGSYIELDDCIFFFIGGAETRDKHNRIEGMDYFREEIISRGQVDFVFDQAEKIKKISKDIIIIAHTSTQEAIDHEDNFFNLHTSVGTYQNKFLDEIVKEIKPIMYFHGHFHKDLIYYLPNCKTIFYSIGAWLSNPEYEKNDRKYFILERRI